MIQPRPGRICFIVALFFVVFLSFLSTGFVPGQDQPPDANRSDPSGAQDGSAAARKPETPPPDNPGPGKQAPEEKKSEQAPEVGTSTKPPREVPLDDVMVTATRTERKAFDLPAFVDVLSGRDILDRTLDRTVPEALGEFPGVMVQKTSQGQGSPYIRGFTGFRTLFLIDGIRLNNSVFRDGPNQYWNTVDPFSLNRLELVQGPGSMLWGSDAIGGTVQAITRGPGRPGAGTDPGGRLYYRYGSADSSSIGRAEGRLGADERVGVLAGFTGKSFGDVVGGEDVGRQRKTGYHEWDADVKLEYHLTGHEKLVFAFQNVVLDDAWRTHKTIHGIAWEGTTVGNERKRVLDQERQLGYVQYHATELGGFVDAVRASVSLQRQDETRHRVRSDGRSDVQGVTVNTLGAWLQLESATPLGRFTYGADIYYDLVDSFNRKYDASGVYTGRAIQGPVGDNASYTLAGLFVQDEIPVAEAFDLILGGRFTHARASAHDVEDPATGNRIAIADRYSQLTGSVRGLYRLDPENHWHLFAGVAQGFRAPNLSDLTRLDTARSSEIETPSPDLDPEKFLTFELGAKTQHDTLWGQAAAYYTLVDDMIMRTPTGRVIGTDQEVTKRNAGDGFVYGFEVSLHYRFHPQFTAFGDFAWMDSQVTTFPTSAPVKEREVLDRQMPPTGHLGLLWTHPSRKGWIEARVTLVGKASSLSTRDRGDTQRIPPGGTPGYGVITLRGGADVTDYLTLSAAIENLTNQDYRIHGSGVNEPGTNVILAADLHF